MIITAGIYKGRKLQAPDSKIARPTLSKVRMGVFNSLYSLIGEFDGKTFLDLFGGSGIMGLEALSRGFSDVDVYEMNRVAAEIIKKNYATVGLKPNLTIGNSLKLIENSKKNYDVVYVDPPYDSDIYEQILPKLNSTYVVAEHSHPLEFNNYTLFKQKNYGGKMVSILVSQKQ